MFRTYAAVKPNGGRIGRTALARAGDDSSRPSRGPRGLSALQGWLITFDAVLEAVAVVHPQAVEILFVHLSEGKSFAAIGDALGMTDGEVERIHSAAFRVFSDDVQRRKFTPVKVSS